MGRPKSSFAGLGTIGLTAYNSRKLNKMKREFADLQESQRNNSEYIGKELRNIRDLHIASFAGLTIIATVIVGVIRFDQMPNLYSIIGLAFIIIGVLMVNLLGNN